MCNEKNYTTCNTNRKGIEIYTKCDLTFDVSFLLVTTYRIRLVSYYSFCYFFITYMVDITFGDYVFTTFTFAIIFDVMNKN